MVEPGMNPVQDQVDRLIEAVCSGDLNAEDALRMYPNLKPELEDAFEGLKLFNADEELAEALKPNELYRLRSRKELVARFGTAEAPPTRASFSRRMSIAAAVAATFVMLLGSAAVASQGSLPGSPLYPLKRATEQASLLFADKDSEAEVHLSIAERRLGEIQKLHSEQKLDPQVAARLAQDAAKADNLATGSVSRKLVSSTATTARTETTTRRTSTETTAPKTIAGAAEQPKDATVEESFDRQEEVLKDVYDQVPEAERDELIEVIGAGDQGRTPKAVKPNEAEPKKEHAPKDAPKETKPGLDEKPDREGKDRPGNKQDPKKQKVRSLTEPEVIVTETETNTVIEVGSEPKTAPERGKKR